MRVLWITAVVLLIDQVTKVIVRTTMYLHQSIPVLGDWFKLTFTQNPGMAFGISFGPRMLVLILSIIITAVIIGYLYKVRNEHYGYRACLALILGGAIGNIIDRVFYGRIFGYADLFHGEVVDFIHFDVWRGTLPEWLPFFGGSFMALFPIWNVADMAIVIGVVVILAFQNKFHPDTKTEEKEKDDSEASVPLSVNGKDRLEGENAGVGARGDEGTERGG